MTNKINTLSTILATLGGVSVAVGSAYNSLQFEDNLSKPNQYTSFVISITCSTVGGGLILGAGILKTLDNLTHRHD